MTTDPAPSWESDLQVLFRVRFGFRFRIPTMVEGGDCSERWESLLRSLGAERRGPPTESHRVAMTERSEGMVEAVGIEPTSEERAGRATTCVSFACWSRHRAWEEGSPRRGRQPRWLPRNGAGPSVPFGSS